MPALSGSCSARPLHLYPRPAEHFCPSGPPSLAPAPQLAGGGVGNPAGVAGRQIGIAGRQPAAAAVREPARLRVRRRLKPLGRRVETGGHAPALSAPGHRARQRPPQPGRRPSAGAGRWGAGGAKDPRNRRWRRSHTATAARFGPGPVPDYPRDPRTPPKPTSSSSGRCGHQAGLEGLGAGGRATAGHGVGGAVLANGPTPLPAARGVPSISTRRRSRRYRRRCWRRLRASASAASSQPGGGSAASAVSAGKSRSRGAGKSSGLAASRSGGSPESGALAHAIVSNTAWHARRRASAERDPRFFRAVSLSCWLVIGQPSRALSSAASSGHAPILLSRANAAADHSSPLAIFATTTTLHRPENSPGPHRKTGNPQHHSRAGGPQGRGIEGHAQAPDVHQGPPQPSWRPSGSTPALGSGGGFWGWGVAPGLTPEGARGRCAGAGGGYGSGGRRGQELEAPTAPLEAPRGGRSPQRASGPPQRPGRPRRSRVLRGCGSSGSAPARRRLLFCFRRSWPAFRRGTSRRSARRTSSRCPRPLFGIRGGRSFSPRSPRCRV